MIRLASIGAGLRVEYHEVFEVKGAQWILIVFGMWLMAVPPAMWLDSVRRAINTATNVSAPGEPGKRRGEDREKS